MEYPLALDGDESRTDIRCANADFDRVAAAVDRLVQLDLQFGIPFKRTRYIRLSRDAVAQAVQLRAGGVAQEKQEVSRFLRRQDKIAAAEGDFHALRIANDFL